MTAFSAFVGHVARGEEAFGGGSEMDLWNTARELSRFPDIEVRLLTFAVPSASGSHDCGNVIFSKVMPPAAGGYSARACQRLSMLAFYLRLFRKLLFVPADIFYAKLASVETLLVFLVGRVRRVPVCFRLSHDIETDEMRLRDQIFRGNSWLSKYFINCLKSAAAVVCQKPSQAAALKPFGVPNLTVIGNAHAFEQSENVPPAGERDLVLWVGRCHPLKRPLEFVTLARRLPHRQFALVLAPTNYPGAQEIFTTVEAASRDLENLRFIPGASKADLAPLYLRGRVFVLTSEAEGFPNVVIEAFKYGVPVVSDTLDLDGLLPTATDRVSQLSPASGFCVAGNPEMMDQVVERLMHDDGWWSACSEQGRRYAAETFDARRIAEQYRHLFQSLAVGGARC
ncbi:MAG: glycosyltransferase [Candidatus Sumerlaeaceae bacterium]|nr:glycosyltransferase [Candidatus Sumerlaeaceae bacterium]